MYRLINRVSSELVMFLKPTRGFRVGIRTVTNMYQIETDALIPYKREIYRKGGLIQLIGFLISVRANLKKSQISNDSSRLGFLCYLP